MSERPTHYDRIAGSVPANRMAANGMSYDNPSDAAVRLQDWHHQPSAGGLMDYPDVFLEAAQEMLPAGIFQRLSQAAWAAVDRQKQFNLASRFNNRRHK